MIERSDKYLSYRTGFMAKWRTLQSYHRARQSIFFLLNLRYMLNVPSAKKMQKRSEYIRI